VPGVDDVEAVEGPPFLAEQLHRRHPGDVFLEKSIDARDEGAHGAVRLAGVAAEPLRDDNNQRNDCQCNQGKAPVHHEQDDGDADQHEHVAEDRDDACGEQIVQHVDVGRDPRHQAADRIAIVEADVEALQMLVDLHAHVEHDALAGQLQDPRLQELQRERAQQDGKKQQGDAIEAGEIAGGDVLVDRHLHQVRLGELKAGAGHDGRERQRHVAAIGPQIPQQPAHQQRIVGFAERFFVVE
jgi:hypothetical protein